MNEDPSRRRLGRGLAALIGEIERPPHQQSSNNSADRMISLELLEPNPRNPRRSFPETELDELAQSIREFGLVQPVVARPARTPGHFEIIAGERRWRAAQRAGLSEVPVIIREVSDRVALELAIVENVQRADLNPLEEAQGYQRLVEEHAYTQHELGRIIGKSRSHVANTLRLLKLPDPIRDLIIDGSLSAGHARVLVSATDPAGLAKRIIEEGLSVRQAETLAQQPSLSPFQAKEPVQKDADTAALEKLLSDLSGLQVVVNHKGRGGEVRIRYRTLEQLDELCRRLKSS